jgi:hypothetical protein
VDRKGTILGCGDGPASFNAELTAAGSAVVSIDPLYQLVPGEIAARFEASVSTVMSQVMASLENYVWSFHSSPESLLHTRTRAMGKFLTDFPVGCNQGRYMVGALPELPFKDNSFDLALCSHLLFLYSELLSREFHLAALLEMARVAREVRIFPLTDLACEISRHVEPARTELEARGWRVEMTQVGYQLQRNGNTMMRIRR